MRLLARAHEKVKWSREDFQHKLSRRLADENQAVGVEKRVEKLCVTKMLKKGSIAKSTADASWSSFLTKLKYKLERQGHHFCSADRYFPSSQLCHVCHHRNEDLKLSDRAWGCPSCGTHHHRDRNAAKNLLAEAILKLKADRHTVSACEGMGQTSVTLAPA